MYGVNVFIAFKNQKLEKVIETIKIRIIQCFIEKIRNQIIIYVVKI